MSKRDTCKTNKVSLMSQSWSLDVMPHKSTKKAKAKERQHGKQIIRKELSEFQKKEKQKIR